MTIKESYGYAPPVPAEIFFPCLLRHKITGTILLARNWGDQATVVYVPAGCSASIGKGWNLTARANYELAEESVTLENVE